MDRNLFNFAAISIILYVLYLSEQNYLLLIYDLCKDMLLTQVR